MIEGEALAERWGIRLADYADDEKGRADLEFDVLALFADSDDHAIPSWLRRGECRLQLAVGDTGLPSQVVIVSTKANGALGTGGPP